MYAKFRIYNNYLHNIIKENFQGAAVLRILEILQTPILFQYVFNLTRLLLLITEYKRVKRFLLIKFDVF